MWKMLPKMFVGVIAALVFALVAANAQPQNQSDAFKVGDTYNWRDVGYCHTEAAYRAVLEADRDIGMKAAVEKWKEQKAQKLCVYDNSEHGVTFAIVRLVETYVVRDGNTVYLIEVTIDGRVAFLVSYRLVSPERQ